MQTKRKTNIEVSKKKEIKDVGNNLVLFVSQKDKKREWWLFGVLHTLLLIQCSTERIKTL